MRYVGLDVHSKRSCICVLNAQGALEREWVVRGPWPKVVEALSEVDAPFTVCYEAGLGYGYLHDALKRVAAVVRVAHPGQLRIIQDVIFSLTDTTGGSLMRCKCRSPRSRCFPSLPPRG